MVRRSQKFGDLAQQFVDHYADLYDAAHRQNGGGSHERPIGRGNFGDTDPTGDVAVSGQHERMRWRLRRSSYYFRKAQANLEKAQDQLVEAWAEQDPEFQEKLRRLRQLEAEIEGTG